MRELSIVALLYLSFALVHAAQPSRRPSSWPPRPGVAGFRLAGASTFVLALVAALACFDVTTALLVVLTASCAVATCFVLLAPAFPRAAWLSAALCVPLTAALWLGGGHA